MRVSPLSGSNRGPRDGPRGPNGRPHFGIGDVPARSVIAHISDLHFGALDPHARAGLSAVLLQPPAPDFIVVTGDLTQKGYSAQLRAARTFLEGVLDTLAERHHPARCIVIPGN